MSSSARRRAQFPKLKSWHRNRSGNWQVELGEFRVTIFEKSMGWGAVISHPSLPDGIFTRESYPSFLQAQIAAFDLLEAMKREIGGR